MRFTAVSGTLPATNLELSECTGPQDGAPLINRFLERATDKNVWVFLLFLLFLASLLCFALLCFALLACVSLLVLVGWLGGWGTTI